MNPVALYTVSVTFSAPTLTISVSVIAKTNLEARERGYFKLISMGPSLPSKQFLKIVRRQDARADRAAASALDWEREQASWG